eukprot:5304017-Pyramimonas_sp.AAC.1
MCAALRREPHFESHSPSIREALAQGSLRRNARPALTTGLRVRQGANIYKGRNRGGGGGGGIAGGGGGRVVGGG